MDTNKLLVAGGIGLAIALLVGNSASAAPNTGAETDVAPDATPSKGGSTASTGFPLKRGSKGAIVRKLQAWLGVGIDGDFGPATEAALKKRTGSITVLSAAALDALLSGASAGNQTQPTTTVGSASELAGSLFTACFETKNVTEWGGTYAKPTQTTRAVSSFRNTPDYDTILRVLTGRSDNDLRTIGSAWSARFGTLTGGNFGHTLDHWTSTALKMYGLFTIRTKLASLGL